MKQITSKLAVSLLLLFCSLVSFANNKFALIIGNDDYDGNIESLPTCVNDAEEVDKCLSKLGYKTTILRNASRQEIMTAFKNFERQIQGKSSIGVFFYSGHAVTINGDHFLIPAKTYIDQSSSMFRDECISTDAIKSIMEKNCKYSFLFLDACRDVYIDNAQRKSLQPATNVNRGNGNQIMMCFATEYGKVARPGTERLSPFTKSLTSHLFDKDKFSYIWSQKIMIEVPLWANQKPVKEDNFYSDFYFNPDGIVGFNSSNNNEVKKTIKFNINPVVAKVKFGDKLYDSGTNLLFQLGSTYTYTVNYDGYEPYSGSIKVDENTPDHVDIALRPVKQSQFWATCSKEASVYIDNKYVGTTPCLVKTTSGSHEIRLSRNGYYNYTSKLDLKPGENDKYFIQLTKMTPAYWDWDDYYGEQTIRYHFSPKYQIGLSYMYRPEKSRFSYGLMLASSSGWFRGINLSGISINQWTEAETSTTITVDVNGVPTVYNVTTKTHTGDKDDIYSAEKDPYNEAKHIDANAFILGNVGCNITNGVMLELGFGAAYHQDRYHMATTYNIKETITSNKTTGEIIGEPEYEYVATGNSKWYHTPSKWSPALRLGTIWYIPLDGFDKYSITLGAGYTYLPMNHKFSSWDANIGFNWRF